jgi:hypothetical protein
MDLGDPDVEELEELEGSTRGFSEKSMDYLRGNADESEICYPPRKRMKVSNLHLDLKFLAFKERFLHPASSSICVHEP